MCWLSKIFGVSGQERPSPSNWLPENAIMEIDGTIIIDLRLLNVGLNHLPKVWVPVIPDTNSMDGVFDIGNNNLLISGVTKADQDKLVDALEVGDIAVYRLGDSAPIIHRIIEIGQDNQGRYYYFKGDNNTIKDPNKVRDNEILWISIGTIY